MLFRRAKNYKSIYYYNIVLYVLFCTIPLQNFGLVTDVIYRARIPTNDREHPSANYRDNQLLSILYFIHRYYREKKVYRNIIISTRGVYVSFSTVVGKNRIP